MAAKKRTYSCSKCGRRGGMGWLKKHMEKYPTHRNRANTERYAAKQNGVAKLPTIKKEIPTEKRLRRKVATRKVQPNFCPGCGEEIQAWQRR